MIPMMWYPDKTCLLAITWGHGMAEPGGTVWLSPGARHGRARGHGMAEPGGTAWLSPGARHGRARGHGMAEPVLNINTCIVILILVVLLILMYINIYINSIAF